MNIYDVAQKAGVSIATVSRVVNGSSRVSERTKEKVLAVMKEHDYTPNAFARGLGLDSMKTIGIMCPNIADEYMNRAVASLERKLKEYQYDCILYCSGYDSKESARMTELLLSKRIDALILVGSVYAGTGEAKEETDYIRKASEKVPVFLINGKVEGENIYCGYCDDKQIVCEAVTKMLDARRERILFLSDSHSYSANQKLEGYEEALRRAGRPIAGELKLYLKNDISYVRDMLLARKDLVFDGVLATDDGLAVGALKYAHAGKRKVPEDLAVIGYNHSALALACDPELTTIDNQVEKICDAVVDQMIEVLRPEQRKDQSKEQGEDGKLQWEYIVPGRIIRRCTTDF